MLCKLKFLKNDIDNKVLIFILSHLVIWTFIPVLLKSWICRDMAEHFLWGQQMEWGYYRHPPVLPWLITGWFKIFPTTKFFYFLLSQVNIAVGFYFIYKILNRFLDKERAYLSVLLLELVIYYFFSIKLHHDTILLSMWPLCIYAALKAFETDSFYRWAFFGFMAAGIILTKYVSVVILCAIFVYYILLNKENVLKAFLKTGPLVALFVFCAFIMPHVFWLIDHDFMAVNYVQDKYVTPWFLPWFLVFLMAQIIILLPIILIGHFILKIDIKSLLKIDISTQKGKFLTTLLFSPFIVMLIIVLFKHYRVPPRFGTAFVAFFGAYVVAKAVEINTDMIRKIEKIVYGFMGVCAMGSIIIKILGVKLDSRYHDFPVDLISQQVTDEWNKQFNQKLKNIAGHFFVNEYMSFYSCDHPRALLKFDYKISPWIHEEDIKNEGVAIICAHHKYGKVYKDNMNEAFDDPQKCMQKAEEMFPWEKIEWKEFMYDPYSFKYGFVKPKN
jgi:hypothetical protein